MGAPLIVSWRCRSGPGTTNRRLFSVIRARRCGRLIPLFFNFSSACNFEDSVPFSSHISESICTEVCPFTRPAFKNEPGCVKSPSVLSQLNKVKEQENSFQYVTEQPGGKTKSEYLSVLLTYFMFLFIKITSNLDHITDYKCVFLDCGIKGGYS